ncbi:MAG: metal ABC transporter permease [Anaerolineae bacterium]|nr:metal ABC transporter permease [Anaerolineae bacterium]
MEALQPILDFLLTPMSYQFMQRALLGGIIVGLICGVIGCFVVIRSMSFFGDALAHAVLPGVAIAYILTGGAGIGLFIGGLIAGVGSALGIGWLTRENRLKEDTAIGIVFVTMFALGIAIISQDERAYGRDLVHILFGNILGIVDTDLVIMVLCGVIVVGSIVLFYKELMIISFDQSLARTLKLPSEGLRLFLLILIALTIIASLQVVGTTLMLAMLVVPAAAAHLITHRLHHMILVASLIGIISCVIGIYVSYYLDIAAGPSIVLTVSSLFVMVFIGARLRAV